MSDPLVHFHLAERPGEALIRPSAVLALESGDDASTLVHLPTGIVTVVGALAEVAQRLGFAGVPRG